MSKIEVLVGMIASGKSTYARQRAYAGALVVAHDDLTAMLHAYYCYEQVLRDCYRRMEEDLVIRILESGRDAVIDRTHLTRESRKRWVTFAEQPGFGLSSVPVIAVVFPRRTAGWHAGMRFATDARGRSLDGWTQVALHHQEQADAEPISEEEGFTEIRHHAFQEQKFTRHHAFQEQNHEAPLMPDL